MLFSIQNNKTPYLWVCLHTYRTFLKPANTSILAKLKSFSTTVPAHNFREEKKIKEEARK
jgi:hypothetical protein